MCVCSRDFEQIHAPIPVIGQRGSPAHAHMSDDIANRELSRQGKPHVTHYLRLRKGERESRGKGEGDEEGGQVEGRGELEGPRTSNIAPGHPING